MRSRQLQDGLFFLLYFVVLPTTVTLQYGNDLALRSNPFWPSILYGTIAGLIEIPAFYFFYRRVIPRFLFARRYGAFAVAVLLFAGFYELYNHFCSEGLMAQMTFLPKTVVTWATNNFHYTRWWNIAIERYLTHILVITALAFYRRSRDQERQQLRLELEYLKAQVNPHFLFNTLNNIYSLAQEKSSHTAPLVARLSELLRYVLYESGHGKVPLSREVGFIESYMDIERFRYPDRIDIRFECQGDTAGVAIEPLLLIPFVENAFKHGIREELARGFVEVVTFLEGKELTLEVHNSKPPKRTPGKGGVGLQNVRKRLDLLYPGRHLLNIQDTADNYRVSLTLQLA